MIFKISLLFLLFFSPIVNSSTYPLIDNLLLQGKNNWSLSIEMLLLFAFLSLIPAFILTMTCFTRIVIVFNLLRNAIGTPYSPPNQIILSLSLFLTFFIMSPVFNKVYTEAYIPFNKNKINLETAIDIGIKPIKNFMLKQTRQSDLYLFIHLSKNNLLNAKKDIPIQIILPAFVISELKTAFQIGFIIYIPFLIIDLIVASILMALGMMMVPPATISLPFKLMFFVLADGWNLLITALAQSIYV